jgi:3-phenylpropionate/cinnamic acid dioxygenase small subunit
MRYCVAVKPRQRLRGAQRGVDKELLGSADVSRLMQEKLWRSYQVLALFTEQQNYAFPRAARKKTTLADAQQEDSLEAATDLSQECPRIYRVKHTLRDDHSQPTSKPQRVSSRCQEVGPEAGLPIERHA